MEIETTKSFAAKKVSKKRKDKISELVATYSTTDSSPDKIGITNLKPVLKKIKLTEKKEKKEKKEPKEKKEKSTGRSKEKSAEKSKSKEKSAGKSRERSSDKKINRL